MQISDKQSNARRRSVLAAMVHSNRALAQIAARWEGKMFADEPSNRIGQLCVEHHQRHGRAPKGDIIKLLQSWSEGKADNLVEEAAAVLTGLEAERVNAGLAVDMAGKCFLETRVRRDADEAIAHLAAGRLDKAAEAMEKFRRVELGDDEGINVFTDEEAWREALEYDAEPPLVRYEGALGELLGSSMSRDSFVSFLAPTGAGKSWFLMDLAYRMALNRKRVLFFSIGDMTRPQLVKRFISRATARPLRPCAVEWPKTLSVNPQVDVGFEHKEFKKPVTLADAKKAFKMIVDDKVRSVKDYMHLKTRPAHSMTVAKLKAACERWAMDDWPPDALVVDYADLIVPQTQHREMRDRINSVWEELRGLSQTQHLLLVTATQGNRSSFSAPVMKLEHTSEEIRKTHWVSTMIGISNADESGVRRLNATKVRDEAFNPFRICYVAGCLELGNPAVRSAWKKKKKETDDE